ncbi:MAG: glycosyltransferase family 1 protein [Candidatus Moranbacteria bacterium]|jgi:glycosyltransferase involved in cell wall biosynthesis|nr:glycosyltransferase family 1 protein [Candidatus Moranbacteria bacterium]MDX9855616.1 glycosyltransferase family 1 protein [Candidatus Moranbacteria bacterium]
MRIGIDARFYGVKNKGLGRYTQKLIENLESIQDKDSGDEYFIFLRQENLDEYHPKNKNFHKILADYRWYSFSEQIHLPKLLNQYNLDLVHFPHFNVPLFYRRPFIITIHDLILLHFPTIRNTTLSPIYYWIKFLAYKLVIGSAVRRAKKIITVSRFTRDDIAGNYRNTEKKIEITYEACDDLEVESEEKCGNERLKRYGIMKPYVLYVGNAYPHKNLENLVLSFNEISDNNLSLVLVGKSDYFYRRIKKIVKKNNIRNVIFTDFVSDYDLNIIYKNSKAYIFPSLYEGFGLPPLEAMRRGVPVASSDHGCMKEVLEDSALYFDAKNKEETKKAIEKIISSGELRKKLIRKGFSQVEKYSWEKMAERVSDIYKKSI